MEKQLTLYVTVDPCVEIFHNHIKDLNTAIDKLGPLVARAIDELTPLTIESKYDRVFRIRTDLRTALDELTEVQNREYRDPNSQELLDTSTGKINEIYGEGTEPSNSEVSVTQDVLINSKTSLSIESDESRKEDPK